MNVLATPKNRLGKFKQGTGDAENESGMEIYGSVQQANGDLKQGKRSVS